MPDLSPSLAQLLVSRAGVDGNRCSSNPLWLTLAAEELNLIDASEYLLTDQRYPHLTSEERVSAMLKDTVLGLSDDVHGLYARKFEKLEELLGQALVRIAIGGVALSDVGLAERDIIAVLQKTCVGISLKAVKATGGLSTRLHVKPSWRGFPWKAPKTTPKIPQSPGLVLPAHTGNTS